VGSGLALQPATWTANKQRMMPTEVALLDPEVEENLNSFM
jgi:hypothetical protein